VAGLVVEGALAEVEQVAVAHGLEVVLERAVVAGLELALVQPQGQALARVREPQSVLAQMLPLALAPMLRLVLVRMPRQTQVALSVMERGMALAMGQGIRGSDLKMAPALELRNNA
jgi:hypothetical protein